MGPLKILGKFFKMLKIGYGEDFKMLEKISNPGNISILGFSIEGISNIISVFP